MRVLGIHDGHNASVCLVEDGKIKFAIQEERLTNEKNKCGFPFQSIKKTLEYLNLNIEDIDYVAMASKHTLFFYRLFPSIIQKRTDTLFNLVAKTPIYLLYKKYVKKTRLNDLKKAGITKNIIFVDHHLCHASTAYFGSYFSRDEPILVLTNDGTGDELCATVYIGKGNKLKKISQTKKKHSLAMIYRNVTGMLGFTPLEHEYKLMGMAPYTSEKGTEIGYKIFKDLVKVNSLTFKKNTFQDTAVLTPTLWKKSRYVRFDNICAGLQKFTEEKLVEWVKNCIKGTGINKLALAGGIFMNVKANKKIMELPEVKDMFVFPSCGDETVSIGAAYHVYNEKRLTDKEIEPLKDFYLGDDFSDEEALKEIKNAKKEKDFDYRHYEDIEKEITNLILKKQVVARCKGRMEFGARALGNRSILADPQDLECVREINMMVKKRDFWMPFAPVILEEKSKDYIINPKNIPAQYMILSFDTTKKRNELMAAVHQADFTARPQIINSKHNPKYYKILKEFYNKTGRGVLLNTSFNLHGLPIVHGPAEAIYVFLNSGLKYLALGNYLLWKNIKGGA